MPSALSRIRVLSATIIMVGALVMGTQSEEVQGAPVDGECTYCWNKCPESLVTFCESWSEGSCTAGMGASCTLVEQCVGATMVWDYRITCQSTEVH